jgi:hypothetical protein
MTEQIFRASETLLRLPRSSGKVAAATYNKSCYSQQPQGV